MSYETDVEFSEQPSDAVEGGEILEHDLDDSVLALKIPFSEYCC